MKPFTNIMKCMFTKLNTIIFVVVIAVIVINLIIIYKREGLDLEEEYAMEWGDLDPTRRRAWRLLGWTKSSWNEDVGAGDGSAISGIVDKVSGSVAGVAGSLAGGAISSDSTIETDKNSSIEKYNAFYSQLEETYPRSTMKDRVKFRKELFKWLAFERKKAQESASGGWVNGNFVKSTVSSTSKKSKKSKKKSGGGSSASSEADKQASIDKYNAFMTELNAKFTSTSAIGRMQKKKTEESWLKKERKKAKKAGGGWVNGVYVN